MTKGIAIATEQRTFQAHDPLDETTAAMMSHPLWPKMLDISAVLNLQHQERRAALSEYFAKCRAARELIQSSDYVAPDDDCA